MKHFNKTNKNMTLTQKFEHIKNHFTYDTMNSWDNCESIANKIKIWNLPLTREQQNKAFGIICDENTSRELWWNLWATIDNFEFEHKNYRVFTNGRSDGYLVLGNKDNNCGVIDDYIDMTDNYKDLLQTYMNYGLNYRQAQAEAKYTINKNFDLIVDFDNLCDDLLAEFIYIIDNATIEEEEYTTTHTRKVLCWD